MNSLQVFIYLCAFAYIYIYVFVSLHVYVAPNKNATVQNYIIHADKLRRNFMPSSLCLLQILLEPVLPFVNVHLQFIWNPYHQEIWICVSNPKSSNDFFHTKPNHAFRVGSHKPLLSSELTNMFRVTVAVHDRTVVCSVVPTKQRRFPTDHSIDSIKICNEPYG